MTDRTDAIAQLSAMLPPGSTVYTIVRHVSSSGMTRAISPVIVGSDGPADYAWLVARAIGAKVDQRHGGIVRKGCGMDMAFDLVYSLALALHGDGYALTQRSL